MQFGFPERLGDQELDDLCGNLGNTIRFFANLNKSLSLEVERTNSRQSDPDLRVRIATNEVQLRESQAIRGQNIFASRRIELKSAASDVCAVVLVIATPHVEVLLGKGNVREPGKMMAFTVQDRSGAKAHKMNLEPLPYGSHEMDVNAIAKEIVVGAVRGKFE